MKKIFIAVTLFLSIVANAWSAKEPGLTVDYLSAGTPDYVEAMKKIGSIEFKESKVYLVYNDKSLEKKELGSLESIGKIAFGEVDLSDVKDVNSSVKIIAYPNPTSETLHVEGVEEGQQISVFSSEGKLVFVTTSTDIEFSNQPQGIYYLQVGNGIVKVIKK
ncbi:MAG: T9SS type A sorting domain-containing protein [Paludibacteraceae bacterium]|nr:T9SS type A sorting domain-containing protein [Paludibacteraceae bacterium]